MNFDERAELIAKIDEAENWSDIEPEEYEELCNSLGIFYMDYDDPDRLFQDIEKAQFECERCYEN